MNPSVIIKPRIPGQDAGLIHHIGEADYVIWMRCELCRFSGPPEKFVTLGKGDDRAVICTHAWCFGNAFVRYQLEVDGWARV